jgi:hypothetical protein
MCIRTVAELGDLNPFYLRRFGLSVSRFSTFRMGRGYFIPRLCEAERNAESTKVLRYFWTSPFRRVCYLLQKRKFYTPCCHTTLPYWMIPTLGSKVWFLRDICHIPSLLAPVQNPFPYTLLVLTVNRIRKAVNVKNTYSWCDTFHCCKTGNVNYITNYNNKYMLFTWNTFCSFCLCVMRKKFQKYCSNWNSVYGPHYLALIIIHLLVYLKVVITKAVHSCMKE